MPTLSLATPTLRDASSTVTPMLSSMNVTRGLASLAFRAPGTNPHHPKGH
jgi:hypothetical protein